MIISPEMLCLMLCDHIVAKVESDASKRRDIAERAGRAASRLSFAEGVTIVSRKVA